MLVSALLNNTLNNSKSEFVFLGNVDVCDYLFRGSDCCGISVAYGNMHRDNMEDMVSFRDGGGFHKASPIPLFSCTVISACGARPSFQRMRNLGWIDPLYNYSADSMDMNSSEDAIVHHTRYYHNHNHHHYYHYYYHHNYYQTCSTKSCDGRMGGCLFGWSSFARTNIGLSNIIWMEGIITSPWIIKWVPWQKENEKNSNGDCFSFHRC